MVQTTTAPAAGQANKGRMCNCVLTVTVSWLVAPAFFGDHYKFWKSRIDERKTFLRVHRKSIPRLGSLGFALSAHPSISV